MTRRNGAGHTNQLRVGEKVLVQYPLGPVLAKVIEDRGHIGRGGRRILRIRTLEPMEDTRQTLEVPEVQLLRASEADPALYRKPSGKKNRLRVGERVILPRLGGALLAEVTEDRGDLGYGGCQIVQIRTLEEEEEPRIFEVPAEEVIVVQ